MIAQILFIFFLTSGLAAAQSIGEKTGVNQLIDRPPTANDLLLEIHQFDLFQQQASETAENRGDDTVKAIAKAESAAAEKRDDALLEVQKKAGLKFDFPEDTTQKRDNRLGGLSGSVAEIFIRQFYKAQQDEYNSVLSTLRRYLVKPDNDVVSSFAEKQMMVLEANLKKIDAAQMQGPPKPPAKDLPEKR